MQKFTVVVHGQASTRTVARPKFKYMSKQQVLQIIENNTSDGVMTRKQVIQYLKEKMGIDVQALWGIAA
jgi:hypothetical protein